MNTEDFKREIDEIFPCRWNKDFLQDSKNILDRYINIVACLDNVTENLKDDIKSLCEKLMNVLYMYYDGRKSEAFTSFHRIMNGDKNVSGLFSSIGCVDINPNEFYYRTRKRKNGVEFTIHDMFHIPLNNRGIVSTQRYSNIGYPCLYLGNSVYSCWEEMRRPTFDDLMFSAYKVRHPFKVFDLRIPNDYSSEGLYQTIKRIPLVLACSFIVKNPSDVFKPEYIIPQMFVETIICNNRKITQSEKSKIDPDVIWGVIYTSTHISNDFPYDRRFLENIVLPVIQSNNPANYCYCLASLFDISQPLCYEYESLKENTTCVSQITDEDKADEDKVKKQYEQSKMGYLEKKLKSSQFETLYHIVIDCPDKGIVLDPDGNSVEIKIRTNGPFTVE